MDIIAKARSLRHIIQNLAQTLEDEQAIENKQLYAEWSSDGVDYKFGNKVYTRGIVEFSNICKNDCYYCGIRKSNKNFERYY